MKRKWNIKKIGKAISVFSFLLVLVFSSLFTGIESVKAAEKHDVKVLNGTGRVTLNDPEGRVIYENMRQITADGAIAFCLDPETIVAQGRVYVSAEFKEGAIHDARGRRLSEDKIKKVKSIIFWNWDMSDDHSQENYAYTQLLVWEALGHRIVSLSDGVNFDGLASARNNYQKHATKTTSFNGNEYRIKVGESLTLTDTNENLQYLTFNEQTGWEFNQNGNTVTITPKANAKKVDAGIRNRKLESKSSANLLLTSPNAQTIVLFSDPYHVYSLITLIPIHPSTIKIKKVDDLGNPIPNVVFETSSREDFTGDDVYELTTNEKGEITDTWNREEGTKVYVREKSVPVGYRKSDEVKTVTLVANETQEVQFVNDRVNADLKLIKKDKETGKLLSGVVFETSTQEDFSSDVYELTTNENGEVTDTWNRGAVPIYIREKTALTGYVKSTEVRKVTLQVGKTTEVEFLNTKIRGSIKVVKVDADNQAKKLPGVVFALIQNGKEIATATTDKNGVALFANLLYGNYIVKEKSTITGYVLSSEEKAVMIDTNDKVVEIGNVVNQKIKGNVKIIKVDEYDVKMKLEGATFELRQGNKVIATATTNKQGEIIFPSVEYGEYTLVETKAPKGYHLNTKAFPITIHQHEQEFRVTAKNTPIVELQTTATIEEAKEIEKGGMITLEDEVAYKKLEIGVPHLVKGTLMDKKTNTPFLDGNGNSITAEQVFIPTTRNGIAKVTFTFDSELIKETTDIVVFENLLKNKRLLAVHAEIEDESQTVKVRVPKIKTTATINLEKEALKYGNITLEDKVEYEDLIIGKTYTLKGTLMNKETNAPFLDEKGNVIVATKTFTAKTNNGVETVVFTFDSSLIKQTTDLVVFENVRNDKKEVAVHADINDEGQTVKVRVPQMKTTATINEKKEGYVGGNITIKDVVKYTDLIRNKEYDTIGTLINKATGLPFLDEKGQPITATQTFTAEEENGFVELFFTFDSKLIKETTEIVVFEKMLHNNMEFLVHTDIHDKDQTVTIHKYGKVLVKKTDIATGELIRKGMVFGLYQNGKLVEEKEVSDGIAEFKVELNQDYEIKELKAPQGYLLSEEVVKVKLTGEEENLTKEFKYNNTLLPIIKKHVETNDEQSNIYFISVCISLVGFFLLRRKSV